MDDPSGQLMLCEAWVRFERERGSREDLLMAESKTEPIREAAAVAAIDAATAAAAQVILSLPCLLITFTGNTHQHAELYCSTVFALLASLIHGTY